MTVAYKRFGFVRILSIKNVCRTHKRFHCKAPIYSPNTTVLGIETSCDDTGCAVVNGMGKILGDSLFSQNAIHVRYGGVNPVVAHELHRQNIELSVDEALKQANLQITDIDAVAVTTKPGLLISLQVGVKFANYLARIYNKPLIPIHHMEAHALTVRITQEIPFPYIVLLISGGHSILGVVTDVSNFILLGETLDNAPGEVLDKVARRMKLKNIPEFSKLAGGRAVELAAKNAQNIEQFKFPLSLAKNRDCNFSFSGLQDSFVRKLVQKEIEHEIVGDGIIPEFSDLCAAFQIAIAEHLVHRTERAILFCEKMNLVDRNKRNIVVSGGVACNNFIFKSIEFISKKLGYSAYRPPSNLCTDNGVMIAWNGIEKLKDGCSVLSKINPEDIEPKAHVGKNVISQVKDANLQVKVTRLKTLCTYLM